MKTVDQKAEYVYSKGQIDSVPAPDYEDASKFHYWFRYTPKDSDEFGFFELTQGVNRPLDFIRNVYKIITT